LPSQRLLSNGGELLLLTDTTDRRHHVDLVFTRSYGGIKRRRATR
jgi:hypothetical protein